MGGQLGQIRQLNTIDSRALISQPVDKNGDIYVYGLNKSKAPSGGLEHQKIDPRLG